MVTDDGRDSYERDIAAYAAYVADLIDERGTWLMPIFKRLMQEYKAAKEVEEDLAVALAWHRNCYSAEDGLRTAVDTWAARQPDKPSRSEAIRRLVEQSLKTKR